jgi:hypothetical protein
MTIKVGFTAFFVSRMRKDGEENGEVLFAGHRAGAHFTEMFQ